MGKELGEIYDQNLRAQEKKHPAKGSATSEDTEERANQARTPANSTNVSPHHENSTTDRLHRLDSNNTGGSTRV